MIISWYLSPLFTVPSWSLSLLFLSPIFPCLSTIYFCACVCVCVWVVRSFFLRAICVCSCVGCQSCRVLSFAVCVVCCLCFLSSRRMNNWGESHNDATPFGPVMDVWSMHIHGVDELASLQCHRHSQHSSSLFSHTHTTPAIDGNSYCCVVCHRLCYLLSLRVCVCVCFCCYPFCFTCYSFFVLSYFRMFSYSLGCFST